ncbi:hypothetical protein N7522_004071 [Penicillium canescens]|nr:hypothetical protein N7522_004071 [Penicillium canescens]
MADSRTYHDVLRWREDQITKFYIDHRNHSFSANIVLAFVCLPVLGLMVPGARMLRRAIFAITACLGVHIICNLRIIHVGNGYLIGLMASTWILHIAVLLLLSNPERDFRRLEYTQRSVDHRPVLRLKNNNTIHWQPYPGPLPHRLSWVLGLLFSMRGPTWNWRIDTLRPLPAPLQSSVLHPPRSEALGCYIATVDTCASLLLLLLKKLVIFDILVSFTRRDPYFWGILQTQPLPESPIYFETATEASHSFGRPFTSAIRPALAQYAVIWEYKRSTRVWTGWILGKLLASALSL